MLDDDVRIAVVIPLWQAVITGVFVLLAAGAVCAWQGWSLWLAGAVGVSSAAIAWLVFRQHWTRVAESVLNVDLDGDGVIGQPGQPEKPEDDVPAALPADRVRVEVIQDGGNRGDFIDLPVSRDQLQLLAVGLERGDSFSLSTWTGKGRPFSRAEFEALRQALQARGLITWSNDRAHAQGYALTVSGRHVIKRLAHYPTDDQVTE